MEQSIQHSTPQSTWATWRKREHLLPAIMLIILTIAAWIYTISQAQAMAGMAGMGGMPMGTDMGQNMPGMPMGNEMTQANQLGEFIVFIVVWTVMMIAMMLPAAMPIILLYRLMARSKLQPLTAAVGMAALLVGYVGIWALVGVPVFVYDSLVTDSMVGQLVVPGLLLILGGLYQFSRLQRTCHNRCTNPLTSLMQQWRPTIPAALRLGVQHGIDCLGCCAGLMLALVALGMMNLGLMLTAAVIIFIEKTLPSGHKIARPLGVAMIVGGAGFIGMYLFGGAMPM